MPRPHYDREQYYYDRGMGDRYDRTPLTDDTQGLDAGLAITGYLAAALVAGVLAGALSYAKRRHPGYWVTLSFLFPPVVLLLLLLPKGHGARNPMREPRDDNDSLDD